MLMVEPEEEAMQQHVCSVGYIVGLGAKIVLAIAMTALVILYVIGWLTTPSGMPVVILGAR
jgi:hypothetical protein